MADSKRFVRNRATGELGYVIERDGDTFVRLERSGPVVEQPYSESAWMDEKVRAPLNRQQVGKLMHDFDRLLCKALGKAHEAKREWIELREEEREEWMSYGPPEGIRSEVFEAVADALADYTEEV